MAISKQFEVFADAGDVLIAQSRENSEAQDIVRIHPDQIPLLTQWLERAAVVAIYLESKAG